MKIPRAFFNKTVTIRRSGGEGPYGPIEGALQTVRCNYEERRRRVQTGGGDLAMSDATCRFDPVEVAVIDVGTEIDVDGRTHTVLQSLAPPDLSGKPVMREVLIQQGG